MTAERALLELAARGRWTADPRVWPRVASISACAVRCRGRGAGQQLGDAEEDVLAIVLIVRVAQTRGGRHDHGDLLGREVRDEAAVAGNVRVGEDPVSADRHAEAVVALRGQRSETDALPADLQRVRRRRQQSSGRPRPRPIRAGPRGSRSCCLLGNPARVPECRVHGLALRRSTARAERRRNLRLDRHAGAVEPERVQDLRTKLIRERRLPDPRSTSPSSTKLVSEKAQLAPGVNSGVWPAENAISSSGVQTRYGSGP